MPYIAESLRRHVRDRAQGHCEYCLIHEDDVLYPHEPDHIIAMKHGGPTQLDNLAWSCAICNTNKGPDISSVDPISGRVTPLFHPRRQQWKRHFRLNHGVIEPLTANGRATVFLLQVNSQESIDDRVSLILEGRYPIK